jgi:hypothetical protein
MKKRNLTGEITTAIDDQVRSQLWEQVLQKAKRNGRSHVQNATRTMMNDLVHAQMLWQLTWRLNQTMLMKENVRQ